MGDAAGHSSRLRNRIRHRVIPYLEKILGRNIRPAIWRAATIAGEEEAWIDSQLPDSSDIELSVAKLRALPVALQRRAIFKWLRGQNIAEVGFDVIERVRSLLEGVTEGLGTGRPTPIRVQAVRVVDPRIDPGEPRAPSSE